MVKQGCGTGRGCEGHTGKGVPADKSITKSKTSHSLDSIIFTYVNTAGISDNIKIEINYSMRVHIFPLSYRQVQTGGILKEFKVLSVEGTELFGSKIKALLDRTAPRDLYDVDNMKNGSAMNCICCHFPTMR